MDRIWAGWRSHSAAAASHGELVGPGSVFSKIIAAGVPDDESYIVWRGRHTFAILNAIWYEVHEDQARGGAEPFQQP